MTFIPEPLRRDRGFFYLVSDYDLCLSSPSIVAQERERECLIPYPHRMVDAKM
jgi:hypothetical protein